MGWMKTLLFKLLSFLGFRREVELSTLSTSKGDGKRTNVYVTGSGGLAEYTHPTTERQGVALRSVLVSYSEDVTAEVSVYVENAVGGSGILGASDGTSAAASYYFSEINANLMPSEKVIITSSNTGVFEATIGLER